MKHYLFIMTDSEIKGFQVGACSDVKKTIEIFAKMPTLLFKPKRQNVLVYLEENTSKEQSENRLKEVMAMNKSEKIKMIEEVNINWVELIPGVNIEL